MNKSASRRTFLRQAGLALAAPLVWPAGPIAPLRAGPPAPAIRLSCVSWCFHGFGAGIDPEPAIDEIAALGFDGIELMVNQEDDLTKLWTDAKVAQVRRKLTQHRLELVALTPFFPMLVNLGSPDPARVQQALTNFERCCRLAQQLGTRRIEIIAPHVHEFTDKNGNLGIPSFMYKIDKFQPGDKIRLQTPDHVDWPQIWTRLTGVLRECLVRARRYNLDLLVEPHYHSIIPDTATFQLMWNELRDPAFQLTADTGWGSQQAEYPPMMVYRMQQHLKILQFRDVDGQTRKFVPFGEGVVDTEAVVRALKDVGFNGYVSLEEVFMPTVRDDARRFVATLRELIAAR